MSGRDDPPQPAPTILLRPVVSYLVTCAQCRAEVLEADRLGDKEECALRDHLMAVHPSTIQPATLGVLLRQFVVTEEPPPAA